MRTEFNKKDYIGFNNSQEVDDWVKKHYTQEQLDLFDVKKHLDKPLSDYKGGYYRLMNTFIKCGHVDECKDYDIKGLQNLLLSMKIPSNIIVTRFVSFSELKYLVSNTKHKKDVVYNSFLSTTLLKNEYAMEDIKRKKTTIKIYVPKGTAGMYLPEVNPKSPEFEILMPYGLHLQRICFREYRVFEKR